MVNTNFFCNVSNSISSEISDPAAQKCSKPCKYYFYQLSIQIVMTLTILHSCHDKIYFFFSCFIPEAFPNELFGISIWVFIGGGAGTCHVLCSRQIILWKALKSSFTYKTNEFSIFPCVIQLMLFSIRSSYFGDRHCRSLLCPGQTKETHMINGIYLYTVIIIILVHVKNISHCAKAEHLKNYFTYVNDLVHPCTAHPFTIHCACRLLEELPKAQS